MRNEKMLVDDMMLTKLFEQAKQAKLAVHEAIIVDVFDDEMFYSGTNAEIRKSKIPKAKRYVASCSCTDSGGNVWRGSGIAAPDSIPKFEFLGFASDIAIIRAKAEAFTLALQGMKEPNKQPDEKVETKNINVSQEDPPVIEEPQPEEKPAQYTPEQISKMKTIKKRLQIENDGLNQFVWEWSAGQLKTFEHLTPSNIDSFITFMDTNF